MKILEFCYCKLLRLFEIGGRGGPGPAVIFFTSTNTMTFFIMIGIIDDFLFVDRNLFRIPFIEFMFFLIPIVSVLIFLLLIWTGGKELHKKCLDDTLYKKHSLWIILYLLFPFILLLLVYIFAPEKFNPPH